MHTIVAWSIIILWQSTAIWPYECYIQTQDPQLVITVYIPYCMVMLGHQHIESLISRLMGPIWGPSGADMAQVGHMLAPWTLLSGVIHMLPENYLGVICDYISPLSIRWDYPECMVRTWVKSLHIWMVTMEYNISCLGCFSHHSGTNQFLCKFCINSWKLISLSS